MFDKNAFVAAFDKSLELLAGAEKVTKAALLELSRTVLEAHHATQDVSYINRLVAVLTPVNKRVAILYFKAFSGFLYSDEKQEFVKKDKKAYDEKQQEAMKFLEDPLNNIWSWSAREIQIEAADFDENRMKKAFENILKKAANARFDQTMVVRSFLSAGLKVETLVAMMEELAQEQQQ